MIPLKWKQTESEREKKEKSERVVTSGRHGIDPKLYPWVVNAFLVSCR